MVKILILLSLLLSYSLSVNAEVLKPTISNAAAKTEINKTTETEVEDSETNIDKVDHFIDKDGDGISDNRQINRLNLNPGNQTRRVQRIQLSNQKGSAKDKSGNPNRNRPNRPGQGQGNNNSNGNQGNGNSSNGG